MGNIKEAFEYAAQNPTSPFANNLKQLAASGSLDQEAQKYGIDLSPFKQKPVTPEAPKTLKESLVDTGKKVVTDLKDTKARVDSGETNPILGAVQATGNVAKGIVKGTGEILEKTPVVGDVIDFAGKKIIAPVIKGIQWLVSKGLDNKIAQDILASPQADKLVEFVDAHPDIARTAESVNDIANAALTVVGAGKGISVAKDAAVKGTEVAVKGAEAVADAAKAGYKTVAPVVEGSADLVKMAGQGLARVPDRMATNLAEKKAVEATIKALPSKTAQVAARDGVDITDIKDLHKIAPQNTALTEKLFKTVKDFAARESKVDPIEIVGSPIIQRIKELNKVRQSVGAKLGAEAKNLGNVTKPELTEGVFGRLQKVQGLQGLTVSPSGALNFAKTTLASTLSKADRKAIQEAFSQATKWGNGEKAHLFRQELFEILGGKKKSLSNITDTQEKAYDAIRAGLSDVLETKNPAYKTLSNQYRKIVQPLGDMRKLMKNIDPNSSEDILNMSAGLLARRLTSAAPSNPIVRNILKGLDQATGKGKTQVSVENLQNLYNLLNKYYDIAPKTGFQNLSKEAHTATGVLDAAGSAIKNLAGNTNVVRQASLEKLLKEILSKSRKN